MKLVIGVVYKDAECNDFDVVYCQECETSEDLKDALNEILQYDVEIRII